jgi:hypothetical protein
MLHPVWRAVDPVVDGAPLSHRCIDLILPSRFSKENMTGWSE